MNNYMRPQPVVTYEFDGYQPYGAGDAFCIDQRLEHDFSGNALQQLLAEGYTIRPGTEFPREFVLVDRSGEIVCSLIKGGAR